MLRTPSNLQLQFLPITLNSHSWSVNTLSSTTSTFAFNLQFFGQSYFSCSSNMFLINLFFFRDFLIMDSELSVFEMFL